MTRHKSEPIRGHQTACLKTREVKQINSSLCVCMCVCSRRRLSRSFTMPLSLGQIRYCGDTKRNHWKPVSQQSVLQIYCGFYWYTTMFYNPPLLSRFMSGRSIILQPQGLTALGNRDWDARYWGCQWHTSSSGSIRRVDRPLPSITKMTDRRAFRIPDPCKVVDVQSVWPLLAKERLIS